MKVYNKRTDVIPKGAVYVGRPSKWGNPFKIGPDGGSEEVVQKYRESINKLGSEERNEIRSALKGKDLVCWCAPNPCHADVLLEIAND